MKILTYGIYLIVFCLPLYLVRFEIFGIPTTVLELMIYALFIAWAIKNLKSLNLKIKDFNLFIAVILILIGVSLTTIFSSELRMSAGIWKAWFIDPILFFIVLVSVIKNSEQIKKGLFSLFLSGTAVSIIALVYLILGKLDPVGRLQGFYNSPNYLAMYIAPTLLVGFGYYLLAFLARPSESGSGIRPRSSDRGRTPCPLGLITRSKTIPKTFILLSVVCLLLSLFFTHSYGAWLGIITAVGFGLVFYLFKLNRKNSAWIIFVLALIIILFLGYFALTQRETSFNARLIIWQKALEIFKANPFLGIGPGTFGNYFSLYPEWGIPQPHNIFLAFLLQTGLMGFVGFIWLLIWFFRSKADQPWAGRLQLLLMMIMVYILVHGFVDTTYWKNDLSVIFWLVIALMVVIAKNSKS